MDGQRLYEARVLELVRQSVMLYAKRVTNKTDAPSFVTDAIVTLQPRFGNQHKSALLENGECKDSFIIDKVIWVDDVEKILGYKPK